MTEEQRQMTLGQLADAKLALEENIKNQLLDFMKQYGINNVQMEGYIETRREIGKNDVVEVKQEGNVRICFNYFLND